MKILLPIKPEYINKIISKTKRFEFRKIKPTKPVDSIIFYVSKPIQKIVLQARVVYTHIDTPINIWNKTQNRAGITKNEFMRYFKNSKNAIAYELGNLKLFNPPKSLAYFGITNPPQSFIYVD